VKRRSRQAIATSIVSFTLSTAALAQISGTWTGLGTTADFNDPYNWSSFPNVPGNGGVVTGGNPFRSETLITLNDNVTLSRWENSGSFAFRTGNGTGSITLVGEAVVATDIGPPGPRTRFTWTDAIDSPIHGQNGLTKTGTGRFAVSGINTYTGGTHILDGWLIATRPESLGALAGSVTLDGGGLAVLTDLRDRHVYISANVGTFLSTSVVNSGTLGSASGPGSVFFAPGDVPSTNNHFFVVDDFAHTGSTTIASNVLLGPSADTAYGKLSATQHINAYGGLTVGTTSVQSPGNLINDSAVVRLQSGAVHFSTSAQPEIIGQIELQPGRSSATGTFTAQSVTRSGGGILITSAAAHPQIITAPALAGSGAAGTPAVGVVPFAVAFSSNNTPRAITFDGGLLRPLQESEWVARSALVSTHAPDSNVTVDGLMDGVSAKAVRMTHGSAVSPGTGTVTIHGGGLFGSAAVTFQNRISFLDHEGIIHGPMVIDGSQRFAVTGAISGSGGLTVAGDVSLRGASTYTGETHLSGRVEVAVSGAPGTPGPLGLSTAPVFLYGDSNRGSSLTIRSIGAGSQAFERDVKIISNSALPTTIAFSSDLSSIPLHRFHSNLEISGVVTVGAAQGANSSVEMNGIISGDGLLQLDGGATLTLRGNGSYTGGTVIRRNLAIGSDSALGSGPVWVEFASPAPLSLSAEGGPRILNNALSWPGSFSNTGTIRFDGTHPLTFTSTVVPLGTATLNLAATAPLTFAGGWLSHEVRSTGTGTLQLAWYRGRGINAQGGRINFIPGSATTSRAESLAIASTAVVDLNDHTLVIVAGGGSLGGAAGVRELLAAGRLTSSMAQANPSYAVGYGVAGDVLGIGPTDPPAVFFDQLVRDQDVLIRYTFAGDADLNGTVNLNDFTRLAAGFGSSGAVWAGGDFNYDGLVDLNDFTPLAANFGATAARAVPEPALPALIVLFPLATAACRRARRRPAAD